jgi:UDP-GlcNAc:undecaprenyl-phosphate/decaprenyl-phosphate GlcNAc-1-phosphate transferase
VVLMSMCAGFLPHNVHPARIFMGDSGAMPLGMLLAAATITLTGRFSAQDTDGSSLLLTLLPLVLPLAVILIPALDTLMAIVRRARAGLSVSAPDKKHLHHRLLALGHTQWRAVLIMWVWAAVLSFGVVLVALVGGWTTYALVGASVLLAIVLTLGFPSRADRHVP